MEVPGKRVTTKDKINIECEPCADDDNLRAANGLCLECDQFMCTECFQHHRKGKFCKNHVLGDLTGRRLEQRSQNKEDNNGETCEEHLDETVKFYCPKHVQVGCGDCMILKHKTCKVEYIRKNAAALKETEEFQSFNSLVDLGLKEVAKLKIYIKDTKIKTEEWSARFKKDVETFRDKLVSHVNKLANDLLLEGEKALSEAKSETSRLETEVEELSKDISILKETTDVAMPQKQFIATIKSMPKLKPVEEQLSRLKKGRTKKCYEFLCNPELQAVTRCQSLGRIRELTENKKDETDGGKQMMQDLIKKRQQINLFEEGKRQYLLERQLRAHNIRVDGDVLTKADNDRGQIGIYVDRFEMKNGRYFEVEIIWLGAIGVGVVPRDYPMNSFPGWNKDSVAYHADDGKLYYEKSRNGDIIGPVCKAGDKIGCGYFTETTHLAVYFTRNGVKIKSVLLSPDMMKKKLCPAVGLALQGVKVKVCLDAKSPIQDEL